MRIVCRAVTMEHTAMQNTTVPLRITPALLAHLRSWEGRGESVADAITTAPVRGLAATLDREDDSWEVDSLPPLWHWLYFLPRAPQREIGVDGHPRLGGFLPSVPLPRRMWAGGRLKWHAPLRIGYAVQRESRIASITQKPGRTGDLVFVLVQHEIRCGQTLCISEEQDIVYRAPLQPGEKPASPQAAPAEAAWSREVVPDPVMLFRYSALTFNGHRIHYDRSYATQQEGYPGLVVHGPLIATLQVDLLRRHAPEAVLAEFSFKAVRPAFDLSPLTLLGQPSADGKSVQLWARDDQGWLTMQATAKFL